MAIVSRVYTETEAVKLPFIKVFNDVELFLKYCFNFESAKYLQPGEKLSCESDAGGVVSECTECRYQHLTRFHKDIVRIATRKEE